jgi:hypothetical protein
LSPLPPIVPNSDGQGAETGSGCPPLLLAAWISRDTPLAACHRLMVLLPKHDVSDHHLSEYRVTPCAAALLQHPDDQHPNEPILLEQLLVCAS